MSLLVQRFGAVGAVLVQDTLHSWAQSANISKAAFARLDMPNNWIDTSHATSFVSDWTTIANCERFLREPSLHKPSSPLFFLYCSVVNPHPPYRSNATWEAYVNRDALSASLARTKETYHLHAISIRNGILK